KTNCYFSTLLIGPCVIISRKKGREIMKRHIPALVTAILLLISSSVLALQNTSPARQQMGIKKSPLGDYPKGALLSAQRLFQDGTMIHLSGSGEIRIFTTEKQNLVIRSEEADYNAVTGEVSSRGT